MRRAVGGRAVVDLDEELHLRGACPDAGHPVAERGVEDQRLHVGLDSLDKVVGESVEVRANLFDRELGEDGPQTTLESFQAIFFDMDGLFLDSEPQWHEAETLMMRENGYDWKPEDQLHCLGGPLHRVADTQQNCEKY